MDRINPEQRRKTMQAVKSSDSQIELSLRKKLWAKGYRYRKNYKKAAGKPDIAFVGLKIAVFCDSDFWHGYNWSKRKYDIKSNRSFWFPKIERNIARDKEVTIALKNDGWTVIRFWGHEIENNLEDCVNEVEAAIEAARND